LKSEYLTVKVQNPGQNIFDGIEIAKRGNSRHAQRVGQLAGQTLLPQV
jgi:hypothetical protein